MAQQYGWYRQYAHDLPLNAPDLKKPRNFYQRLVYSLIAISPFEVNRQLAAAADVNADLVAITRQPEAGGQWRYPVGRPAALAPSPAPSIKRFRRNTPALSSLPEPDWKYRLAAFMNRHIHINTRLDLSAIDEERLATLILNHVERQPELIPEIARLTLFGSHLYGERRGEEMSPEQQRELVGQALCKLIFKEDSIPLRIAKIFVRIRPGTLKDLTAAAQNWSFTTPDHYAKEVWQRHYEAYEMPEMYLHSELELGAKITGDHRGAPSINNTDALWVGSPTWVLLHTGARAVISSGASDLSRESGLSLIQLGLGIVSVFEPGFLAKAAEPALYSGLLFYHLYIHPAYAIDDSLPGDKLTGTLDHLIEVLASRHDKAKHINDSFTAYQQVYNTRPWRGRKWAAEELLDQYCGKSRSLAPMKKKSFLLILQGVYQNAVLQLMAHPGGQRCHARHRAVPDLDEYYRAAVERISRQILQADTALLAAAFTPSDFQDDNLQQDDDAFLQHSEVQLVEPRLYRKRRPAEMFFSNVVVKYFNRPDTAFLRATRHHEQRLYALRITDRGYLLRRINIHDPELRDLRPYMQNWPTGKIKSRHDLNIITLKQPAIQKSRAEPITQLIARYADMHYQAYRVRLYQAGYDAVGKELPEIIEDIKGLIIPFYDCVNSLREGDQNSAFIECSVDGILVGLPLFFTGIKASLTLYRMGLIGAARAYEKTAFVASTDRLFKQVIPISAQIAGGVVGTNEQLHVFLFSIGKRIILSFDPGIAAMRSLVIMGNSLRLAIAGYALLKFSPKIIREGLLLSSESHKFLTTRTSRLFEVTYGYGENGHTPLTLTLKGIEYSIMEMQPHLKHTPVIAVENGELTGEGYPVFVQLDIQTQLGIYKKYVCLDIGKRQCQLQEYQPAIPPLTVNNHTSASDRDSRQWLLSSTMPIHLAVVYPQHRVFFADQQKLFFEINGHGWAFCPETEQLSPVGYLDDWHMAPRLWGDPFATIDIVHHGTVFNLNLQKNQPSMRASDSLSKFRISRAFLSPYELDEQPSFPDMIGFYDPASLKARIDQHWYWLVPEARKSTFLLTHPQRHRAGTFRVEYDFISSSFVLSMPSTGLNSHRLGQTLAREMNAGTIAACKPYMTILLPPLLNGAFSRGNTLFLKAGDKCLNISHFDDLYYMASYQDHSASRARWTLRYELFTESFALIDKTDPILAPINDQPWSRLEALAMRTYNDTAFPTLTALCRTNCDASSPAPPEPALRTRLRQVALLLRLDPLRRATLLHASSSLVRAFKMDTALTSSFTSAYPALAIWTTFENILHSITGNHTGNNREWQHRLLAKTGELPVQFPPPTLTAIGPKQQLFLLYAATSPDADTPVGNNELLIDNEGLSAVPISQQDGLRRWLPDPMESTHISASKHHLRIKQQLTFWLDRENRIIGQRPDDDRIRFAGNPNRHMADHIVTSPNGVIVVVIYKLKPLVRMAEFYRLPASELTSELREIPPYKQINITGIFENRCESWVTNQGELFVPDAGGWISPDKVAPPWPAPAGFKASFIAADQCYLGYYRVDENLHLSEVMLYDIARRDTLLLRRGKAYVPGFFGVPQVASVAFSALNALVAVGYSDGYIEFYRIAGLDKPTSALSLGGTFLPLARYTIDGSLYPKAKQMVMKFNNAFDDLMVFHDIGDCDAAQAANFTYAVTHIFPQANSLLRGKN
ncbi:hypothetical protein ACL2XP_01245 [Sodalis sp. RH21]|uniref:hypothetical protein n=1 Tax=unclassified Sodalis (in: enterobacteria) TaxID=2636512 RepID=UPI0039B4717D